MTSAFVCHLYDTFAYQTQKLSRWDFIAKQTADAFAAKGLPFLNCFGLLDGKLYGTTRPGDPDIENAAFSGYKRRHGQTYQAFVAACGLHIGWFGPGEGTNHTDSWHYANEDLHGQIHRGAAAAAALHGAGPWCIFSDGAYPHSAKLQKGYMGNLTADERRFNSRCNKTRVAVEWDFHGQVAQFPFVDTARKQLMQLSPVALNVHAALVFHNWWVCCYGGQLCGYFQAEPPTLARYFQV